MRNKSLIVLALLCGGSGSARAATILSTWANSNYGYRVRVDIDGHALAGGSLNNIPNAPVSNFPVNVPLTCANNIDCTKILSNCNDIVFYDSDQTTALAMQREGQCTTTSGLTNDYWVKKTINGGVCTGGTRNGLACQINSDCSGGACSTGDATTAHEHFWAYYGYSGATNTQSTAVWDSNYKAVYLLSDNCTGANCITDATANGKNSIAVTLTGNAGATGKVGLGIQLNNGDGIGLSAIGITGGSARTLCAWYKPSAASGAHYIMGNGTSLAPYDSFFLQFNVLVGSNAYVYTDSSDIYSAANSVPAGLWHYLCATYTGSGVFTNANGKIYIDGIAVGTTNASILPGVPNSSNFGWALSSGPGGGTTDMASWSNIERSATWIASMYQAERHDCNGGTDPIANSCFLTFNVAAIPATVTPTPTVSGLTPTRRPTNTPVPGTPGTPTATSVPNCPYVP